MPEGSVFDEDEGQQVRGAAITSLTDNSGGTGTDTIAAISAAYSQTEVRNAVASLTAKVNAILVSLRDTDNIAQD